MKFRLNTPEQEAAIAKLNATAIEEWGWDGISSTYVDLAKRVIVTLMDRNASQVAYSFAPDGTILSRQLAEA
jgi:hypothetical protein